MTEKPDHIRLTAETFADADFDTKKQAAAAKAILEYWDDTHNFAEIARRSGWSSGHIRNVFHTYFEPAEETIIPPDIDTGGAPAEGRRDLDIDTIIERAGDGVGAELLLEMFAKGYEYGQRDAEMTHDTE